MDAGISEVLDDHKQEYRMGGGRQAIILTAFGVWDAVHGTRNQTAVRHCSETVTRLLKVTQTPTNIREPAARDDAPPPTVFLLQNNPFLPGSDQQHFLDELHGVQRQIVENDKDGGVYIVNDEGSIFSAMSCLRMNGSIHFTDPVKLVEGKMLWDLIALVAGADV